MPDETIYLNEMTCVPLDDKNEEVQYINEESQPTAGTTIDIFSDSENNIALNFIYGIVIIGFIYSVGDYIFNSMPQGIVAQKLQHA